MNVFNPENIQPGDMVKLLSEIEEKGFDNAERYLVETVGGKNNNKVWCRPLGQEFYASCFKKD